MSKQKTAMLDLKEDLLNSINTGKDVLNEINNDFIRDTVKKYFEATIKNVVKRIDDELFEVEKNQMRRIYNQGNTWASEIGSEEFFDQEYTQSSE